jgi:hypothetical protein
VSVAVVATAPSAVVAAQRTRGRFRGLGVVTAEGRLGCVGRGSPWTLARGSRTGSIREQPAPGTHRGSARGRRTSSTATLDTEVGALAGAGRGRCLSSPLPAPSSRKTPPGLVRWRVVRVWAFWSVRRAGGRAVGLPGWEPGYPSRRGQRPSRR